jgi:hypothetical protein
MASGAVTFIYSGLMPYRVRPASFNTAICSALLPAPLMAVMEIADRFPTPQANISSYREAIPAFLAGVLCAASCNSD